MLESLPRHQKWTHRWIEILTQIFPWTRDTQYQGANETLGVVVEVPAHGLEFDLPLGREEECLTDVDLLVLLEELPQLEPYKELIKGLIAARGFIPGEVC
jgi:hypothetical protein